MCQMHNHLGKFIDIVQKMATNWYEKEEQPCQMDVNPSKNHVHGQVIKPAITVDSMQIE